MTHREAIQWLAQHAAGGAPDSVSTALELHVRSCGACQQWLDTHRLLGDLLALPPESLAVNGHPDTAVLALCVTRPEEIEEPDRGDLLAHLHLCSRCREVVEVVRHAMVAARPGSGQSAAGPPSILDRLTERPRIRVPWLLAAAASLLALAVPAALLLDRSQEPTESGRIIDPSQTATATTVERVESLELEGRHLIGAKQTLLVSHVQVNPGAHVTFRAGEAVQLAAGFRISEGASVAVEVTESRSSRPPPSYGIIQR